MQPDSNQVSTSKPSQHSRRRYFLWAGLFLVLILVILGLYLHFKKPAVHTVHQDPAYNQTYQQLDNFKLAGPVSGSALSFDKPPQLDKAYQSDTTHQVYFIKFFGPHNQTPIISQIDASIVGTGSAAATTDTSKINQALANPTSSAYKSQFNILQTFVDQHQAPFYNSATLSKLQAFSLSGSKSSAWVANFTVKPQATPATGLPPAPVRTSANGTGQISSSPTSQPDMQGRVIVAFGKSAVYYFLVSDTQANWQTNQNIWGQVTASLAIDQ